MDIERHDGRQVFTYGVDIVAVVAHITRGTGMISIPTVRYLAPSVKCAPGRRFKLGSKKRLGSGLVIVGSDGRATTDTSETNKRKS
jgi:hypothetical protein